jgi:hypothetical protein
MRRSVGELAHDVLVQAMTLPSRMRETTSPAPDGSQKSSSNSAPDEARRSAASGDLPRHVRLAGEETDEQETRAVARVQVPLDRGVRRVAETVDDAELPAV